MQEPKLEDDLHKFIEQHLYELFRLKLIKSEFRVKGGSDSRRPDTLAFDEKKYCFVVIEYKKTERADGSSQLTAYASAGSSEKNKHEMIKAADGMGISTSKLDWDAYYCIYIGFDVSEKLIDDTTVVTNKRMYEIHVYDGIVVLQRVGMNKDIKEEDDGLAVIDAPTAKTQDQTPTDTSATITDPLPGWESIIDLDPNATQKHLPRTLQFPDGTSVEKLQGWSTVLREVANWLHKKGCITDTLQSKLLSTNKTSRAHELRDGLYINVDYTAKVLLSKTKDLLRDINYRKYDFKLTRKPKSSGK